MEALDHKCPSCGAKITFHPKEQKWVCEYCGSKFSLEELQKYQNASSDSAGLMSPDDKSKLDNIDANANSNISW